MNKKISKQLSKMYDFMGKVYPANWQTRWGRTPYMGRFASQIEIDEFVQNSGRFETIPGHVWASMGLWNFTRRACPALDSLVNSTEVYERLWSHDLGETHQGDKSLYLKFHHQKDDGKEDERKNFVKMIDGLPEVWKTELLSWFDEFEGFVNGALNLEF